MTIYDATCMEIFLKELHTYVKKGGIPPLVPALDDFEMMDTLGDIAGYIVMSKSARTLRSNR
jgi:hypothetical protein